MNSIQHFFENCNGNIDFSSITSHVQEQKENFEKREMLKIIKKLDDDFFKSGVWKEEYKCNGFVSRTIITPFGELTFKRRYYMNKNKSLQNNFYYVDSILKLPKRKLITNEALTLIINVCTDINSSYAASNAIPTVIISKQTVSNYLKKLNTIKKGITTVEDKIIPVKETVEVVYVEADEAHCNLQHNPVIIDSSSEIKTHESCEIRTKPKNIINKLVVTHSGPKEPESRLKRKVLANKRYNGGIHMPTDVLADNVCNSILNQYNIKKVKYIFVSGDGANWIKSLYRNIKNFFKAYNIETIFVLDKFHLNKYLKKIFANNAKAIKEVKDNFKTMTKDKFSKIAFDYFNSSDYKDDKKKEKDIINAVKYICNNITGIKNQKHEFYKSHCSMEGQISHVLARRLTSRPMGFCETNLQNITQMLIFSRNGNKITTDVVKKWTEDFMVTGTRKYTTFVKKYEAQYTCNAGLPALNSTNTNLKNLLTKICHGKTY